MKIYEDKVMEELHKIREENYYATKNMSSNEYAEKINQTAYEASKLYGFKIKQIESSYR